jgi:hypothetical protein
MASIRQKIVPHGSRVDLVIDRIVAVRDKPKPPKAEMHNPAAPAPYVEPVSVELYDLGVTYQEYEDPAAHETRSKYTEISLEVSNRLNATDRAQVRFYLLSNLTADTTVAHSGRAIPSSYRLQAGSSETDGTITTVKFEQNGTVYNGNPLGETIEWAKRVPTALRIADLTAIYSTTRDDDPARVQYLAAIDTAVHETWERWEVQSRSRVLGEGTLRKRLTDGQWGSGIDSYAAYQPWLSYDPVNFRCTEATRASAAAVPFPPVRAGTTESTRVQVLMAPQMFEWEIRWVAHYSYSTIFSSGDFFLLAVTQYCDRLPFFPFAYQLDEVGNAANWPIISRRVAQTSHYRALLALDLAIQVISGPITILLAERIAGRWTIRFRPIAAGSLCAVTKTYYNGSQTALVRYVWRTVEWFRLNAQFDRGHLDTAEVVGGVNFWSQFEDGT